MCPDEEVDRGELDITSLYRRNAGKMPTFYASEGTYEIQLVANACFKNEKGVFTHSDWLNVYENEATLPVFDEADLKHEIFGQCNMWAHQLGNQELVIHGVDMKQEKLREWFEDLITGEGAYPLYDVTVQSTELGDCSFAFTGSYLSRDGVDISLNQLMLSSVDEGKTSIDLGMDTTIGDEKATLPTEGIATEDTVAELPTVVEISRINGLRLTKGTYSYHPTANQNVSEQI